MKILTLLLFPAAAHASKMPHSTGHFDFVMLFFSCAVAVSVVGGLVRILKGR